MPDTAIELAQEVDRLREQNRKLREVAQLVLGIHYNAASIGLPTELVDAARRALREN